MAILTPSVHVLLAALPSLGVPSELPRSALQGKASSKLPVVHARLATSAVYPASAHSWLAACRSLEAPSAMQLPSSVYSWLVMMDCFVLISMIF